MKDINPKTLAMVAGIIVIATVAAYYGGMFSAVDNGIIKGDIRCSADNTKYVFKIDFYTPDPGEHHIQAFCADDPRYQVMRLAVVDMPVGDIGTVTVECDCDEWDALMPCDKIDFQLYNADKALVYWRIDYDSMPSCATVPTPTPTLTPTPTPTPTPDEDGTPTPTPTPSPNGDTTTDIWVLGGVAVFLLLLYFAFRKQRGE